MNNRTILQGFEWYLPADGQHWKRLTELAEVLHKKGINGIWLPPAYKGAQGLEDVGYAPYDLYDLGEFDQKGTVSTKYGTIEDYLTCIKTLKKEGIEVYGDIVFDHFMGADEEERVSAVKYRSDNRNEAVSGEEEILAWTKFTFPGRNRKYNEYTWSWRNFSGVDFDDRRKDHGIFNFEGKGWDTEVDSENGNYDYLMGCNLDMEYPETVDQLNKWGQWYQALTDIDGYRLDAVKHIQFNYFVDWLLNRRKEKGSDLFVVGEYWNGELEKLTNYIDSSGTLISLFDVPLHYHFYEAAHSNGQYDMRNIFEGTLAKERPEWAVTFVDNHDTQKGQSLESWVDGWFKVHAYALILLRKAGTPVVFWGDMFGIPSQDVAAVGKDLELLLKIRERLAYGNEMSYFDDPNVIGWVRTGTFDWEKSGYAVIMTNAQASEKTMTISAVHAGKVFVDILGNHPTKVVLDETGAGTFPVNGGEVSVYVNEEIVDQLCKSLDE
ncbi:alpha-amylase [Enterococcus quebecensis]|uniref:Alpha-amylase n=1 Tax=Enterococcus quebecensis TaxID=903983 RepID=A0A1E5H3M0_9ENTE|nr:alpha-amylase [Enterococcus quebecensis]OEG19578.1 alpha-amylase [Enterococcus quebecensis]OJG75143.1 hypothetical protein RV12_GL001748 [Enterococcus quebecensis]